jgi:hypothetical protein
MVFRGNKIYGACLPRCLQVQDSSYFAITLRQGKCLRGFHIRAVIVLNISFSVNKKDPSKWVSAAALTERVHSDKLIYLAIEMGEC